MVTGGLVDAEHASALAGRRADASGEFGEIVGLGQAVRFFPLTAIDEVVPLRNQIMDGTARGSPDQHCAGVAEGHAAIHAAGALAQ